MSTPIVRRAIPPAREAANRVTIDALAVAVNELSGAIGTTAARALRVGEAISGGLLILQPDGALALNPAWEEKFSNLEETLNNIASALAGLPTFDFGTYTPTTYAVSNIDSATASPFNYLRVGDVVAVGGRVLMNVTAANVLTSVGISLPIPSDFSSVDQCSGTGAASGEFGLSGAIFASVAGDYAALQWVQGGSVTNRNWDMSFVYLIR